MPLRRYKCCPKVNVDNEGSMCREINTFFANTRLFRKYEGIQNCEETSESRRTIVKVTLKSENTGIDKARVDGFYIHEANKKEIIRRYF